MKVGKPNPQSLLHETGKMAFIHKADHCSDHDYYISVAQAIILRMLTWGTPKI